MGRAPCCEKVGLNRGPWTREEDLRLTQYIKIHGEGSWRILPKAAGLLRCGKSCRLRWINYLRPDLKRGNITEEEDRLIIKLHALLGNRWSLIAGRLPGRTDNEIKNYWNTHLKKKLRSMGIDPNTHQPLQQDHSLSAQSSSSSIFLTPTYKLQSTTNPSVTLFSPSLSSSSSSSFPAKYAHFSHKLSTTSNPLLSTEPANNNLSSTSFRAKPLDMETAALKLSFSLHSSFHLPFINHNPSPLPSCYHNSDSMELAMPPPHPLWPCPSFPPSSSSPKSDTASSSSSMDRTELLTILAELYPPRSEADINSLQPATTEEIQQDQAVAEDLGKKEPAEGPPANMLSLLETDFTWDLEFMNPIEEMDTPTGGNNTQASSDLWGYDQ